MKYQTDSGLGPFINKWGCFFCSILEKVEKHSGYHFAYSDITGIYLTCIRHKLIQQEVFDKNGKPLDGCDILDKVGVYNTAANMLNLNTKCLSYREETKEYKLKSGEDEILELKRNGYHGSHFVSGNGNYGVPLKSEIEFDPIEGGSNCARDGWIESKRIFTIKDGV